MAYRALTEVLLGNGPAAQPGDILPDTFPNMSGAPEAVDFERLLELGAVEKVAEDPPVAVPRPAPHRRTKVA